jgi:hypothetical protein
MSGTLLGCYHHCNCEDRPAVARCTKCGKGLCQECTDRLRSRDTGQILCVDCLNQEVAANYNEADRARKAVKRELIFIIIGFIIGFPFLIMGIATIASGTVDLSTFSVIYSRNSSVSLILPIICICLPFLLASLRTIFKIATDEHGFILGVLIFVFLMLVSPIIFIWRVVVRIRDIKLLKSYKIWQTNLYEANQDYFEVARGMSTRLESMEAFKNRL